MQRAQVMHPVIHVDGHIQANTYHSLSDTITDAYVLL